MQELKNYALLIYFLKIEKYNADIVKNIFEIKILHCCLI